MNHKMVFDKSSINGQLRAVHKSHPRSNTYQQFSVIPSCDVNIAFITLSIETSQYFWYNKTFTILSHINPMTQKEYSLLFHSDAWVSLFSQEQNTFFSDPSLPGNQVHHCYVYTLCKSSI